MAIFKRNYKQLAIVPAAVPTDEFFHESTIAANFGEYDIQPTADSENEFPAIAQGYPISGFKDIIENSRFR